MGQFRKDPGGPLRGRVNRPKCKRTETESDRKKYKNHLKNVRVGIILGHVRLG